MINIYCPAPEVTYFFTPEFKKKQIVEQAEDFLSRLTESLYEKLSDKQRDYLTTIYLRAYCGCEMRYLDELSGEWIQSDQHDNGCLRLRFSILEDKSDRTLTKRKTSELPHSNAQIQRLQEALHE